MRASGDRVLFTEQRLSLDALRPIARDLDVTLAVLDPLGGLPGRESLVDLRRPGRRGRGAPHDAVESARARELVVSARIDAQSGPSIVVMAGLVFLTAWAATMWRARQPSERAARRGGAR
jgi:hypothetical protein